MDMQRANDLGFFKGLSDQCPVVIERFLKEVFKCLEFVTNVICISGWKGIGTERILKYVAKRVLVVESKVDVLIWVVERNRESSIRNFQFQVADRLGILNPKDGEEDEETVDEAVKTKIQARLKDCKFLLVHNGTWDLDDLWEMGIPKIKNSGSMIFASSDATYHQHVKLDISSDEEFYDLLVEESLEICDHLAISSPSLHITPEVVMDCILYLFLFDINIKIETIIGYWFAEGFIGTPTMDLDAIFKCGQDLYDELQYRNIVKLERNSVIHGNSAEHDEMLNLGKLFSRKLNVFLVNQYYWISINHTENSTSITTQRRLEDIRETFFENMENVRVLSLIGSSFTRLPSSITGNSLKLLDLNRCENLKCLPLPYLGTLGKLEVLDLSETPLTELPDNSFEGLQSLRLLNLSKCRNIVSLPPSLSCLLNLEHLLLEDCQSLSHLPTSVQPLEKLQLLHLSGTNKLVKIPEQFFQGMVKLKDLNLSLNSSLISLPTSIFNLVELKKLNLEGCSELQNMTHCLKHFPSSLEELNLSKCNSLQEVKLEPSSFPNLRILNLGFTPVKVISFQNFSSLENLILDSNEKLEVVELCNSKIRKFPLENAGVLRRLARINLFGAKHLGKVDWDEIRSLPQQVNLDQCGDGNIPHMIVPLSKWQRNRNDSGGSIISLRDGVFFQTLRYYHHCIKNMQRFFVYVCPCAARGKNKTLLPQRESCSYKDIYSSIKPSGPSYAFERCIVIERVERFPKGIGGVLRYAQLLSLHDEEVVTRLSDFGIENFRELMECWIERCHAMKVIFDIGAEEFLPVLQCLENLHISNLKRLTNMCISTRVLKDGSFGHLKHLQLEYCPHIVNVFSSGVRLESLETLEIKFCARLKEVFATEVNEEGCLQHLHTLCLLELPALSTIIQNVQLVSLKKLKVRGCPKLRKLPLYQTSNTNQSTFSGAVAITGESEWWERLEWEDNTVKQPMCFSGSRPFKLHNHI